MGIIFFLRLFPQQGCYARPNKKSPKRKHKIVEQGRDTVLGNRHLSHILLMKTEHRIFSGQCPVTYPYYRKRFISSSLMPVAIAMVAMS